MHDAVAAELAIRELACRYAQAIDRCDFDALKALWCEDGEQLIPFLDTLYKNRDEVILGCRQVEAMFERTYHAVHNHLIRFSPQGAAQGEASGEVYCVAMHFSQEGGKQIKLDMGLRYLDNYRLVDGQWLFARRELLQDWTQRQTLD